MAIDQSHCCIVDDPHRWDSFVEQSPYGHLLQSYKWGELKKHFGWKPDRIALETEGRLVAGAQILYHPTPIGSFAYIPKGPVANPEEHQLLKTLLESVHELARSRGAVFLKIEPNVPIEETLRSHGFRPSTSVQARSTVIVDLSPDLDTISAGQKSKTRYNVGLAARRGVSIRQAGADELTLFSNLMEITGERDKFHIRSSSYFQQLMHILEDKVKLFLASYQNEVLAGILVSAFGQESIYLYGASSNSHRNLMPTYLIQWEAMKWAKAQGCTRYDLWGIPEVPEDATAEADEEDKRRRQTSGNVSLEGAWGLYRFKSGFGGQVVNYPGAFDYVYSPARYWVLTKVVPRVLGAKRRLGD